MSEPSRAMAVSLFDVAAKTAINDGLTVCAWGANADPIDSRALIDGLLGWGGQPHHLGLTKTGFPKHPLYLRADTTPIPYQRGGQP